MVCFAFAPAPAAAKKIVQHAKNRKFKRVKAKKHKH
jgi:hypothetical protein